MAQIDTEMNVSRTGAAKTSCVGLQCLIDTEVVTVLTILTVLTVLTHFRITYGSAVPTS